MRYPASTDTELDLTPLWATEVAHYLRDKLYCVNCRRMFDIRNCTPDVCVDCSTDLTVVWLINYIKGKGPGSLLARIRVTTK